jgi:hypothetical protein
MTIKDGFIVDVSSFCDRWCTRCPFTARCEMFVKSGCDAATTTARIRMALLEQVQMLHTAVEHTQVREHPRESNGEPSPAAIGNLPAGLEEGGPPDPAVIRNSAALHRKKQRARLSANAAVRLAEETIAHFALYVPVTSTLCIGTVAREGAGGPQSFAHGWGKAAMLGLDRMKAAWQLLVDTHHYTAKDAAPFLEEIARMQRNLQRAVPNAREFVRPGFDEMAEVSLLDPKLRKH